MIERYTRSEMAAIWSDEAKLAIWHEIEAHACDAMADLGLIPRETAEALWKVKDSGFDLARIREIESEITHEFLSFLTYLSEVVGGEDARFVHQGMTSSDVLDTAFSAQLRRACDLLVSGVDGLLKALKELALKHRHTPCIGRSHGVHAEPTTFGLKMAQAYAEMSRNRSRLAAAGKEVSIGAISGAVGTFANVDPAIEAHVCERMGLSPEPISTQVIPRDRHAMFFATLGVVASSIERIAIELRHLQRTEVLEAAEAFGEGRKGSSAMPHKRNPEAAETLTGLSRLVRMACAPAMESVALWHERDMSHSSVERVIGPDATIALDFALAKLTKLISNLEVYPENMAANMRGKGALVHSQRVLLALTQKGASREDAYRMVQRNAQKTWDQGLDFAAELRADPEISKFLPPGELEALFDLSWHTRHVDAIFKRVFGAA